MRHFREMFGQKIQPLAVDQLERCDHIPQPRLQGVQQTQRTRRIFNRKVRGRAFGRAWQQAQAGGGDDAQRSLGPDQQMAQIVAGVILSQPLQVPNDGAVGQNRLDPQHQVACITVSQNSSAARIGSQDSAHPRRPLGCDGEGEQPARSLSSLLNRLQGHAGLNLDHIILGGDIAHRAHPVQRQQQHPRGFAQLPADKAGAPAIGDHTDPRLVTHAQNSGYILNRGGAQNGEGLPMPLAPRLLQPACAGGFGAKVRERLFQTVQKGGCGGCERHTSEIGTPRDPVTHYPQPYAATQQNSVAQIRRYVRF